MGALSISVLNKYCLCTVYKFWLLTSNPSSVLIAMKVGVKTPVLFALLKFFVDFEKALSFYFALRKDHAQG